MISRLLLNHVTVLVTLDFQQNSSLMTEAEEDTQGGSYLSRL